MRERVSASLVATSATVGQPRRWSAAGALLSVQGGDRARRVRGIAVRVEQDEALASEDGKQRRHAVCWRIAPTTRSQSCVHPVAASLD
jgi:trehalose-6-phosphate synthase